MERWCNKIAVVTGASSGIGRGIAEALTRTGCLTIGLARREDRLKEIQQQLSNEKGKFHYKLCDMTKREDIERIFHEIIDEYGPISILINNAGIFRYGALSDQTENDINDVMNTNLMGLLWASRCAIKSMKDNNIAGHLININSILGHKLPENKEVPTFGAYAMSKHALVCMTEVMRKELIAMETGIKLTSLSPGLVHTEITEMVIQNLKMPFIESKDMSDAVLYILSTPPTVNIKELIIGHVNETI